MHTLARQALWGHAALGAAVVVAAAALAWPLLLLLLPFPLLVAGRLSPGPRPAVAVYAAAALLGAGWLAVSGQPIGLWITGGFLALVAVPLPWLVGLHLRNAAALEEAGWEKARILESESRLVAERARMRERSRIAGDLHDAVGHELSLLTLRAGALEMAQDLPEGRRDEAARLREAAGRATERLAESVGVLRADGAAAPLQPTGDGIGAMVERARSSGMEVSLSRHGDVDGLPLMVDRAVHRVVQESLTNAARHSPGAGMEIVLAADPDEVVVEAVSAGADGGGVPDASRHGGTGLVSLRERVRVAGGTLWAGPHAGGWKVSARLPVQGAVRGPAQGGDGAEQRGDPAEGSEWSGHRRVMRRTAWAIGLLVGVPVALALAGYVLLLLLNAETAFGAAVFHDAAVLPGAAALPDAADHAWPVRGWVQQG